MLSFVICPRYKKHVTSSSVSPFTVISIVALSFPMLIIIVIIFLIMSNPYSALFLFTCSVRSCNSHSLSASNVCQCVMSTSNIVYYLPIHVQSSLFFNLCKNVLCIIWKSWGQHTSLPHSIFNNCVCWVSIFKSSCCHLFIIYTTNKSPYKSILIFLIQGIQRICCNI